jgi:hypothetical protein
MDIKEIQKFYNQSKIKWSQHCLERMQERDISRNDVKNCIINGEIIEEYPEDFPNPSCLIFGYTTNNKIIHVVFGKDENYIWIITAYFPNEKIFGIDLKTRKEN